MQLPVSILRVTDGSLKRVNERSFTINTFLDYFYNIIEEASENFSFDFPINKT
jgi:hypothetical protein